MIKVNYVFYKNNPNGDYKNTKYQLGKPVMLNLDHVVKIEEMELHNIGKEDNVGTIYTVDTVNDHTGYSLKVTGEELDKLFGAEKDLADHANKIDLELPEESLNSYEVRKQIDHWLKHGQRGLSSNTIYQAITKAELIGFEPHIPRDPADFKRCYLLLEAVPLFKKNLHLVYEAYPKWKPFVREWSRMEKIYLRDKDTGSSVELYNLMMDLAVEGASL